MSRGHVEHFAERVVERRRRLGLTLLNVKRNGGPTAPTLAKAEAGELEDPRPSTLAKFDEGLDWAPGSAARAFWDGEEPSPRDSAPTNRPLEPADDLVSAPLEDVLSLMIAQTRLSELVENAGTTIDVAELAPIVAELGRPVSSIVGRFVTNLLERNRVEEIGADQHLIEFAFADLLAAPVDENDPERTEKLYRRWLLDKAIDLPDDLTASFRRRWRQRARSRT